MVATIADIVNEAAQSLNRLLSRVESAVLSAGDVAMVRGLVDQADFVCTQTVAKFSASTAFPDLGHRDVSSWLSAATGTRKSEGLARCAQAQLLEDLPLVGRAVRDRSVTISQLRTLAASVTRRRLPLAKRDEQVLVDAAIRLDASQFAQLMQRWVALADDELVDPAHIGCTDVEEQQFLARRLQMSQTLNGMWRIQGQLDPVSGEAVHAALASVMPKPSPGDSREPAQRRADALTDLCRAHLAQQDRADVGNERPNVHVVFHAADGSAHTTGGWFLRNWQLSQVLCDATMTAVAASMDGVPFDVGTPVSAIPVRNRKAVVVRDRCCRFPHCARPARWSEVHHIRERANQGTHELPNLVLLCTYHHREVHRRGIALTWDGPVLVATLPSGVMLHGPPHPATQPTLQF